MTLEQSYRQAVERLTECGVPEAAWDAWYLLEHVTGLDRAAYLLRRSEQLPGQETEQYEALVEQRAERVPLQYLTGEQEFMGFCFRVNRSTLIPRQDTEILTEQAMRLADGKRVLDLCTGTGCIIISLAKLCHLQEADGADISEEAVMLARENAKRLGADVRFFCGDLFAPVGTRVYDVIVSNPPYIRSEVIPTLQPEVREHEPISALDGDRDGLLFYRRIIEAAPEHLSDGGNLLFEIGCEQAGEVSELFRRAGFGRLRIVKDYAGLDRVVIGEWRK